jgi:hypothetical protein
MLSPLVSLVLVSSSAVQVSTRAACPSATQVSSALEVRLRGSSASGRLRYELLPASAGEAEIQLELEPDSGAKVLSRTLRVPEGSCQAAAEAMAIIVARHLQEISWSSGTALPEVRAAPPPSAPRRLTLSASGAAGYDSSLELGVALDVRLQLWERFELLVGAAVPVTSQQIELGHAAPSARVWLRRYPLRLGLPYGFFRGDRLSLSVGPELGLQVEQAGAEGLEASLTGTRVLAAPGLSAGAAWLVPPSWRLFADLSAYRVLRGGAFRVEGLGEVFAPPPWRASIFLGFGYVFSL